MKSLSSRQKDVLEYLQKIIAQQNYPPSVREICSALGFRSSSTAHAHLAALERKGYIRKDPTKPRAIKVLVSEENEVPGKVFPVPLVGDVAAGKPILAHENIESYFPLPVEYFPSSEDIFMLQIKGDSMVNAGIHDGDYVIVRRGQEVLNGDIVVALLEDDATVKRFFRENGKIRLQPENENYEPTYHHNIAIQGKVIGLFRKM